MRGPARPAVFVAMLLALLTPPHRASAQGLHPPGEVILVAVDDATLADLLSTPGFLALANQGGAGLVVMQGSGDVPADLADAAARSPESVGVRSLDYGSVAGGGGAASPVSLQASARALERELDRSTAEEVVAIVVASPPSTAASGGRLAGVIVAHGPPADLADAMRDGPKGVPLSTFTSDSTRRLGVVTSADLVESGLAVAGTGDAAFEEGARIEGVDVPPPLGLYDRYIQSKRLSVPIGTAAGLFVTIAGLLALAALLWRASPRWSRSLLAWVAISSPFLALSLLLAGHLASLTYATAITFVVAVTVLGTLSLVPVARRKGTLVALAVAGSILLAAFVVEAALGWTAALTPLLGGSQLDGGRFFGLPNAFIGLLLGGSIYVAQRLPRAAGAVVIAGTGLFAGLPWTGSNLGAAVTLFAGAGIWWGLRGELGWARTTLASIVAVAVGTGAVVFAHRYLTSAPTHITRFAERTEGLASFWSKLIDRLQVGTDLIARNPFALVPVLGVLGTLALVLWPPAPVRLTFTEAPVWRAALLAIVLASIVAYLANDSGAAAIGEGFTTSFAALLYVSLLRRNDIMEEP